jgi:hypothetical protein
MYCRVLEDRCRGLILGLLIDGLVYQDLTHLPNSLLINPTSRGTPINLPEQEKLIIYDAI